MRELFLLNPDIVFLNHGSFGACPAEVFAAYQRWQLEIERNPVELLGRRSAALLEASRAALGAYLHASPEDLVYVSNATTGVNTVARSIPLGPGDEILTTDHEYGACDNAWEQVCGRTGARIVRRHIPLPFEPGIFADLLWEGVSPRTRLITLSAITSSTALIFPVAEVCRRARAAGIPTLIDGAHVPGHIPLDLEALGSDFYVGNCHKWLCAPKGAGFLHARPEHHEMLEGLVVSWGYSSEISGHTGFEGYTGSSLFIRRHQWQGTRDISAFLTVPDAIAFQERHGWGEVRRRCHALAAETLARVCAVTGLDPISTDASFGQMVAIPVPSCNPEALKDTLFDRYRIEVPVTSFEDRLFVRAAFQGYNTPGDADALVEALRKEVRR